MLIFEQVLSPRSNEAFDLFKCGVIHNDLELFHYLLQNTILYVPIYKVHIMYYKLNKQYYQEDKLCTYIQLHS